jgi:glutamine synthetase
MSKADVLKTIKDEEVDYVDIRFTDPRGKLQHVTLMADQVDEDFLEEGFMFDGSSIQGWKHGSLLCREDPVHALFHRRAGHRRGL